MPRTRSIKPEFWSDEKLASLSRDCRLLFIGLWHTSDDYAVTKGHPLWLKSQIFPYDNLKPGQIEGWLKELEDLKRIILFSANGEKFYYIANFDKHQTIDRPSAKRNPNPPQDILTRAREALVTGSRVPIDETETETETEGPPPGSRVPIEERKTDSNNGDFLSKLKANPAYAHIDILHELSKMDAWLMLAKNRGRKKTPRFVLNWLNKIEKPLEGLAGGKAPW